MLAATIIRMQRASPKGLVCGSGLTIHLNEGNTVEVNDFEGTLVPASEDIAHFDVDERLSWVLVVEKEARVVRCPHMSRA